MAYKLGLEFFNGSIITLATDRFSTAHTYSKRTYTNGIRAWSRTSINYYYLFVI